jgi:hypothetical protein
VIGALEGWRLLFLPNREGALALKLIKELIWWQMMTNLTTTHFRFHLLYLKGSSLTEKPCAMLNL